MLKSNGSKSHWQELYAAAAVETDREKLSELVNFVEEALMLRSQELAGTSDHQDERSQMNAAARKLLRIKTEKLGWPKIKLGGQ